MKLRWLFVTWLLLCLSPYASGNVDEWKGSVLIDTSRSNLLQLGNKSDAQLVQLGDELVAKGQTRQALVMYMVVCNRQRKKEALPLAQAYLKAGNIFYSQSNYAEALSYFIKGLKVCDNIPAQGLTVEFYKNIGNVYCMFRDYEHGINCYNRGIAQCKAPQDNDVKHKLSQNLIGAYISIGQTRKALEVLNTSFRAPHKQTDISRVMDQFSRGLVLFGQKRYDEAIRIFNQVIAMVRRKGIDAQYECSAYSQLAEVYQAKGMTEKYGYYLEMCVNTAMNHHLLRLYPESLKKLSDFCQQQGDHGKALTLRNTYWNIRDSIYNDRSFDIVKNEQLLYEVSKYEQSINSLHQEQEQKEHVIRRQRFIMLGILIFVLLVSGFSFYIYQTKKRLNKSYRNLYVLNKSLIRKYHTAQSPHQPAEGGKGHVEVQPFVHDGTVKTTEKYKTSNLTEEQKQRISADIQHIMEDTEAFCSQDFSLDKLAELVSSNSRYVSQVIHERFDKNFTGYVNDYRVNLAKIRLADFDTYGNYTIKAIGESVGFRSQTSFTNIFKAMTGITPAIYQRMAREEQQEKAE